MENIYGSIELYSDLLDFNQLLSYQIPEEKIRDAESDSAEVREPPGISEINFPNIEFTVNIADMQEYEFFTYFNFNSDAKPVLTGYVNIIPLRKGKREMKYSSSAGLLCEK